MAGLSFPAISFGQDGQNTIKYSALGQQFVSGNTNGDANSSPLPSVATQNGYASFFDNPASMGLIKISYFSTGLLSNYAEQTSNYLGSSSSFDNSSTQIGNAGLIYRVPTERGNLVVGGGFTLNNIFNRTSTLGVRNNSSSITDSFKDSGSGYNDIAFEAYAIDFADVEETTLESIFRIGFAPGEFLGIRQDAEISQMGSMGEFSIFSATEIQKNLFIGASLGVVYGNYNYKREFQEKDDTNVYDSDIIDQDTQGNNGTDVESILLKDEFDSEILGSTVRAGALYKLHPNFNVGVSVVLPTQLIITETYYSEITTNLDDIDRQPFGDELEGNYTYSVRKPGQLNVGFAFENVKGFTVSTSVEMTDYRNTSIDLTRDSELSFDDRAFFREQEEIVDSLYNADYSFVANLKAGVKYRSKTGFEIRGGFGLFPGKSSTFRADRTIFSSGIGIPLSNELYLDLSTQYSKWDDRSILYEFNDSQSGQERFETLDEKISQINFLVGIKYRF